MTVWIGWPGVFWGAVPDPAPGVVATLERPSGEHTTLSGSRTVDFAGFGRRSFRFTWERLTPAEYAVLEATFTGSNGVGPWMLATDDTPWNYLTSGQASATAATGDTTGWTVATGETLTSAYLTSAPTPRSFAALGWSLPNPTTSGRLTAVFPGNLSGWPAVPGVTWTFTVLMRTETATTLTASVALSWLDDGYQPLSTTLGASLPVTAAGWVTLTASATPPDGALAVVPEVRVTPATVTAPTVVYLDAPRFELGIPSGFWLPGRGLPLVSMTALTDRYPWADCHDADATFLEVG